MFKKDRNPTLKWSPSTAREVFPQEAKITRVLESDRAQGRHPSPFMNIDVKVVIKISNQY